MSVDAALAAVEAAGLEMFDLSRSPDGRWRCWLYRGKYTAGLPGFGETPAQAINDALVQCVPPAPPSEPPEEDIFA